MSLEERGTAGRGEGGGGRLWAGEGGFRVPEDLLEESDRLEDGVVVLERVGSEEGGGPVEHRLSEGEPLLVRRSALHREVDAAGEVVTEDTAELLVADLALVPTRLPKRAPPSLGQHLLVEPSRPVEGGPAAIDLRWGHEG
ncbi:MAG: hypothetical protein AAFU73_23785 [Planctomycetota bacterium]